MSATFFPKQAVKFDGALAQELQGNVTEGIAQELLKVVPPIKSGFVIHDNGCGYGSMTGEIMNSGVPNDIKIHATDKSANYLAQLRSTLTKNPSWPVEVAEVNANDLTFADNYFDLSITDFVLLGLDDEIGAAKHILRTVKPGGTAAIAVWKEKPWQAALKEAHRRTPGDDAPIPPFLAVVDYDTEQFKSILNQALDWIAMPQFTSHISHLTAQLASTVTIYTHGNEELAKQIAPMLEGKPWKADTRKIAKFALKSPGDTTVEITFEDGTTATEAFIGHAPMTLVRGPFAEQLGLKLSPTGGEYETNGPFQATSVPGVYAAGDTIHMFKVWPNAVATGAQAAAGVAVKLQEEKWNLPSIFG
ncbi:hypothetical protein PFICI_00156 [Pestalotiopsis fici W106-1]|uniref:Methyltransferase type 11 domain-containing protein n=1 Tax=Pestalotiopsis fici (strain W106-1 / CGMCC3.15140) TaxID=1229662 RepID=W3XJW6_PESFW|nr:uncharacterized protein PFICI_00156 [Pestalotiopsis fici W106-1]ETS86328.1 hypothetical protein PFICI_00156 [Pestalotiopsis fici W106-1]